jgi:hypothetical protein
MELPDPYKVARTAELAALADVEECQPKMVYEAAIRQCCMVMREANRVLRELRELRDHVHDFQVNDNDRCLCIYCGTDGDA